MPPHSILKKKFTMFFSSDTATGAKNVSQDGSEFSVQLNNPLTIPANCLDCSLSVIQANIWNVSPNISADFGNNVFAFVVAETPYSFVIPDGLYSLSGLNAYLSSQFSNLGLSSNVIVLSGDDATQKTILTFTGVSDRGDFTVANSCRDVLGFDSRIAPPLPGAPSVGFNEFSDNPANFNRNNSYLITSNIVSGGIAINSTSANIIASVPITVAPGSQITYSPRNVLTFSGQELIGAIKNSFNFQLRNQSLEATPTQGELWSLVILFEYSIPI
jgi:hypothetical protein